MKKKKLLIKLLTITSMFGIMTKVNAASVSLSASSSSVTKGGSVTFYVTVNATGWNITGNSSGATSGCNLRELGDTGTGKPGTKTFSATCYATDLGVIGFSLTGDISDENGNTQSVSKGTSVNVIKPRDLDTNNDLSSLKVGSYKLSPAFNKDTLEYTVDVPSTVDKINIEAEKSSNYSTIEGIGEKEVNEGANNFEIKVTSETGITKTYKLTVNVKDENPIKIKIDNNEYTVIKNPKNVKKPESFVESKIKINNIEVPAYTNDVLKITIVAIKDTNGKILFAIYNSSNNTYELYIETKSTQLILFIKKIPEQIDNLIPSKVTIDNIEYECLKTSEDSKYSIVYATNVITGKSNYYTYDKDENTFTKYDGEQAIIMQQEITKLKKAITYLIFGLIFTIFIILILLITRPKRRLKRQQINQKIEKDEPEPKKDFSEKSKKPKNIKEEIKEAREVIKEYEKKDNSLDEPMYNIFSEDKKSKKKCNKKEVIKEEPKVEEENIPEETMYDIFSEDKRKKKK